MRKKLMINLNEIDKIRYFCALASLSGVSKVTLFSGRYVIDGKSIHGIFSLDLSKDIECEVEGSESAIVEFEKNLEAKDILV